jgi:hypothetical protein
MPCNTCNKCVIRNGIAYCDCLSCNECHMGGFCPNGKTWWNQLGKPDKQEVILPGQSHGGHGWIPTPKCKCTNCTRDSCARPKHKGGHFSHCGNTCRNGECRHY